MTTQEQQMLQGLIERVNQTQLPEKDSDAEQMLAQTLGKNPDALYVLAQTVLVQGYALEQAQKQLADARTQVEELRQQATSQAQPAHHTSFLGNLLGLKDEEPVRAAAPPPPAAVPAQYAPVPYAPVPGYVQPAGYAPAGYAAGPQYGMAPQGGFLRTAMQTAAGVAAGALAFEGIEGLMHGFGHAAGYGPGFGGFGGVGDFAGGGRPEEIVNNYYGDAAPGAEHTEHAHEASQSDFLSQGSDLRGVDDRGRDDSRFSDAVYTSPDAGIDVSGGDYDASADDNSAGDVSGAVDDSSSFDDTSDSGGGFDSGGGDGSF